jgi:CHAD domain-containing protein
LAAGKWISDLGASTPVADAALRVLAVRLGVVRDYLGPALRDYEKDPEYVHQLRVGTRRAGAALDIFRACLTERAHRKARKYLRRLRRAAGAARDWDVFLIEVSGHQPPRGGRRAGFDFLLGYAAGQRLAAQAALAEAAPDYPFAFERLTAETLHAVGAPEGGPTTLLDLALPVLGDRLRELDDAAAKDLEDYGNLHRVRIAGKRLRYAMEVFADCFGPAFKEVHYPAVEEMQEILGRANDSHVARGRLEALRERIKGARPKEWKRYRAGVEGLIEFHQERLPEERRRFEGWWKSWQESGGEAAFHALLKAPAAASQAAE